MSVHMNIPEAAEADVKLPREFVLSRLVTLGPSSLRAEWGVDAGFRGAGVRTTTYYKLDLKQCFLRKLNYAFGWGDARVGTTAWVPGGLEDTFTATERPQTIIVLDLSMNDFAQLDEVGLGPFLNLRHMDASCNHIIRFRGVSMLENLYSLDLSFNSVRQLGDLGYCPSLVELNLNHNLVESLDGLPVLYRLRVLRVDGNKSDVIPASSLKRLTTLDLSYNKITDLTALVATMRDLTSLEHLVTRGNPVEADRVYWRILSELSPQMRTLDNVLLKQVAAAGEGEDYDRRRRNPQYMDERLAVLQPAAEALRLQTIQLFMSRIRESRLVVQDKVRHLQDRIVALMNDQQEFEQRLLVDMDLAMAHIVGADSSIAGSLGRPVELLGPRPQAPGGPTGVGSLAQPYPQTRAQAAPGAATPKPSSAPLKQTSQPGAAAPRGASRAGSRSSYPNPPSSAKPEAPRAPSAIPRAQAPPGTMYDPNSKKYVKTQLDESRGPQPPGSMWDPYTKQYVKTTGGQATGKN